MWDRIFEIIRKELLQLLREPRMRVVVIVPPMVQLIIFGYAVNLDVEHARVGWFDQDRTPASRELRARFEGSPRFSITALPASGTDVQHLLDRGEVQAVLRVLPGFGRDVARGDTAQVQILIEGTNSNTASLLSSYSGQIISRFSNDLMVERQGARRDLPSIASLTRVWFNPELLSRNYFVPGVLVNIIMIVTVMLTSLAVVREKEIGTMEQLMVTPIRPIELIIGKTLPFGIVGLIDLILTTALALIVFRIPFRGSFLLLLAAGSLFVLTTLGIGLFVSTLSHTQQQAMMGSFFFLVPAFMLSGFAFPIANMPVVVQYLTFLDPLRYFVEVVRGIFLKGTGALVLWPQILALLLFGITILALSALRFHKRLE
jgi:ABC-2 type transport system permease protein